MKILFIGLSMAVFTTFAQAQTSTTTNTETSGRTSGDVQTAVDLYKTRAAEGGKPTLTIKDGEATVSESAVRPAHELSTGAAPGEFTATPSPMSHRQQIDALKAQVEALQKLNEGLEKELATCQGKQGR